MLITTNGGLEAEFASNPDGAAGSACYSRVCEILPELANAGIFQTWIDAAEIEMVERVVHGQVHLEISVFTQSESFED